MKNKKFTLDEIQKYWTDQAKEHGASPSASWSDHRAIDLEIKEIVKYLNNGDRVLDIGCANGYSTIQFACQKNISIKGIDYIPEMIQSAKKSKKEFSKKTLGNIEFKTGDILSIKPSKTLYDKVVVIRVIINLNNWMNQERALINSIKQVKKGGLLLLSEATIQGFNKLNKMRVEWKLSEIPMPSFNCYLDEEKVVEVLRPYCKLEDIVNFSSTYFVGTRIIKPILNKALKNKIDEANPEMEWNRWFSQIPTFGDYGTQKLFIFRKIR